MVYGVVLIAGLCALIGLMRREGVKEILMESFYPRNTVDLVGEKAGARTLVMPSDVGATPEQLRAAVAPLMRSDVRRNPEPSAVEAALAAFEGELPPSAVEWMQDDTFDHYDEHAEQIRAFA